MEGTLATKGNKVSDTGNHCPFIRDYQEGYLNIPTAAEKYGLTEGALRSLIKRREVPSYKWGTRRLVKYSELEALLVRYPSKYEVALVQEQKNNA